MAGRFSATPTCSSGIRPTTISTVTWDSSQPNSYFYHPLGTILTRNDDFSLEFDLQLNDAEASGYGFELAIGFLNLAEATSTNFNRSTGANSPDLVEFTYFPDAGYWRDRVACLRRYQQ